MHLLHYLACTREHMALAVQQRHEFVGCFSPRPSSIVISQTIINRHYQAACPVHKCQCASLQHSCSNKVLLNVRSIVLFTLFVSCIHALHHTLDHPMLVCRNFYKMDLGPKPGVSLEVAVLAEGTLTYLLNLVILYATSMFQNSILCTAWYRML